MSALAVATTQPAEPMDWANDMAADIIALAHACRYTDAESLIAAKLRLIRIEGESTGLAQAMKIVERGVR